MYAQQAVTFTGIDDLVDQTGTLGAPMISTHGAWSAIDATCTPRLRVRPSMWRRMSRVTRISKAAARGLARIQRRVDSHARRVRLGSVQLWPLGVGFSLGLHMDRQRAGVTRRFVRPMGIREQPLVGCPVAARARGLRTGAVGWSVRLAQMFPGFRSVARSVCAVTSLQPALRGASERLEHHRQSHVHFAGYDNHGANFIEIARTGRRDDGATRCVRGAHCWSRRQD